MNQYNKGDGGGRGQQQPPPPHLRGRPVSGLEAAQANAYFETFLNASTLKNILGYHRSMCELLHLKPNVFNQFYPKLRANLTSWRAKALWKKFDARASHKCYGKAEACSGSRVLVIGSGPCGLRTAIEAQLLGAKVVVVEKRDRLSRNNVLHLWPFVIEDLRMLGAKKFFGKFCAGAIDHISIRQLQCILLKVALLLGVEVHTEVSFINLIEPSATERIGWRAELKPDRHPVSQFEFDVIIGADGKRNTLQGFRRKEFRGKLAIAITANFINKRTEAETRVEEISGVAFIFNQKFFKDLLEATRIDLENIVYYKDDTHYFVMTAKKPSLLEKGVIKQDLVDTAKLLAQDNVDRDALQNYAKEAAGFSTNYQMPDLEFAVNHYGQPDVAMFDFTSMYAAEYATKILERNGTKLLMILVGDSLLEPFWPTGSGCARGFLSSLDAAWAIRSWNSGQMTPLDVLAERESIYRLLAQTTPDNLNKDWKAYTLDPATRYPNLNKSVVLPHQTICLYDTDTPESIEEMKRSSIDVNRKHPYVSKKRRRGNMDTDVIINWISDRLREYEDIVISDIASIFKQGKVLCALIHHYRPDLLDYSAIKDNEPKISNQIAMDILENDLGILPLMAADEITNTQDYLAMASYLTQIYDKFRGEIPHIKHPKLELPDTSKLAQTYKIPTIKAINQSIGISINQPASRPSSRHKRHALEMTHPKSSNIDKRQRKRRTLERIGPSDEQREKIIEEIAANRLDRQNKRKYQRRRQTEQFIKSMQMLHSNAKLDRSEPFEDYSIFLYRQTAPKFEDRVKDLEKQFTYVPNYDNRRPNIKPLTNTNADEDVATKIKSLVDKWSNPQLVEKKPKDLLRAIGKIETSDWNIKQIEKKILENKMGKPSSMNADKERVPRWSKEEFKARQIKMERKHLDQQDSVQLKYADIDRNIKQLELKLKEGSTRELGHNKVASITEKLARREPQEKEKSNEKSAIPKLLNLPVQSGSEFCHFCGKRVYLMERLTAERRFFHHGCFKCQYCHTQLRLGSYMFDRDGQFGHRFFCIHHYGMQGELTIPTAKILKKDNEFDSTETSRGKTKISVDDETENMLDRVQTPERAEFSNLSSGTHSSDHEEGLSPMDEDEWTDKNFGASCNELDESDDNSSSSLSDSDNDDAFDDALEQPVTKEGTMKWAERWKNSYRKSRHSGSDNYSSSDRSSYYENTSDESDSETATEGEEEIRARELRKQEVQVQPPVVHTDTGTDTEVKNILDILPPQNMPDIVSDAKIMPLFLNKSSSNLSLNSDLYMSAESGLNINMNKISNSDPNLVIGELTITPNSKSKPPLSHRSTKPNLLLKNRKTSLNLESKAKRNFVLPSKDQRQNSSHELIPNYQLEEPLLIIKRTPSKIAIPKEIKPKIAVNTKGLNTDKYFGLFKPPQRPKLSQTTNRPKSGLVKQSILTEASNKINKINTETFTFDVEDADLDEADNYIENLLANKDELEKPMNSEKCTYIEGYYANKDEELTSNSMEDLFKALDDITDIKDSKDAKESDEKIEDLLNWMEELDYQTPEKKVYRSMSDLKYKHLDKLLKNPVNSSEIVKKLPRSNLAFFETILKHKGMPCDNGKNYDRHTSQTGLNKSNSEVHINQRRRAKSAVDLDSIKRVDVKSVLDKFERCDQKVKKRNATKGVAVENLRLSTHASHVFKTKPLMNTIKKFETEPESYKKPAISENINKPFEETKRNFKKVDKIVHNIDQRHDKNELSNDKSDWCVNVTVSSTISPEFYKLQEEMNNVNNKIDVVETAEGILENELQNFEESVTALSQPQKFANVVKSTNSCNKNLKDENGLILIENSGVAELNQTVNLDNLYVMANTSKKVAPPTVPQRKKYIDEVVIVPKPPPRASRQKSIGTQGLSNLGQNEQKEQSKIELATVKVCELPKIVSGESSSESPSEIHNSATEISTDSEFAQDEPTPTREIPSALLNDSKVTKTRGSHNIHYPRRVQVATGFIQKSVDKKSKPDIQLKLNPLVAPLDFINRSTNLLQRSEGYALNRTQSTGGIAAKVSLELKKKYLLGESGTNSIQKSGSASTLDTTFKSFQNAISDCQKLLKPASDVSPRIQLFCDKLEERYSPILSPTKLLVHEKEKDKIMVETAQTRLPPPDITITVIKEDIVGKQLGNEKDDEESDVRPRSPAHETSILVPPFDWSKDSKSQSDSLSMSSSADDLALSNYHFENIPKVQVDKVEDSDRNEAALDSLETKTNECEQIRKGINEKKSLNQPKILPNLNSDILPEIHNILHVKNKSGSADEVKSLKTYSEKSSPDVTVALTETELSDWAKDDNVSDSVEIDLTQGSGKEKKININKLLNFSEARNEHVCETETEVINFFKGDLDSIEYMDNETETSSGDGLVDCQNGYILFKNEEDLTENSEILEATNIYIDKNDTENLQEPTKILKKKRNISETEKSQKISKECEEISLIKPEAGTATEENTCSDSTVKNVTELAIDNNKSKDNSTIMFENLQKQRLEDKLAAVKLEQASPATKKNDYNLNQYEEHCQRLQSKVEFGNAKDSIDIRKSRRKIKSDLLQKPDLIQEEKERTNSSSDITLGLGFIIQPDIIYKKEIIKKERDSNQKLIQEMVMNKMKAENKSLERKRKNRSTMMSLSPVRTSQPDFIQVKNDFTIYATPDLLSDSIPLQSLSTSTDTSIDHYSTPCSKRPLSVFSTFSNMKTVPVETSLSSMPDIRKQLLLPDSFITPVAPPRYNRQSIIRTTEKLKEEARAKAKLKSNEDLGISPEEKIIKLRERYNKGIGNADVEESIESLVLNTERKNSLLYSNDTLKKKQNNSFKRSLSGGDSDDLIKEHLRPKSVADFPKSISRINEVNETNNDNKVHKSESNLLETRKKQDRERRKSVTKFITGIFSKKSSTNIGNTGTNKGLFSKLSPSRKSFTKSLPNLDLLRHEVPVQSTKRCASQMNIAIRGQETTPPPVPPLPVNYSMKMTDESSDEETRDCRYKDHDSYSTFHKSANLETSTASTSKRILKTKKACRKAQLKRHRIAQEIQRKLEETEVKTAELERRGVEVEKTLRGENLEYCTKDETELLEEWFDLMRDKAELRRYEKELLIHAQELQLEDRHARLQATLRERLECNETKTEQDIKIEEGIINEMVDIVAKRDSLIGVLEEDRLRCTNEDTDLEEQMLLKGLILTPIQKK